MRVLLDEQLPRRFARQLTDHDVSTVQQQGWAGVSNGELLRRASAAGFDVFVTSDQNLRFQENLAGAKLGVIVLNARSNKLDDLAPLVPAVLSAMGTMRPGEVRLIAPG
jgi:predicted nuclease of predicted toxin-antitoxin system